MPTKWQKWVNATAQSGCRAPNQKKRKRFLLNSGVSSLSGEWGIYVMDADGSNLTALIKGPDRVDAPAWSPLAVPAE